MNKPLFTMKPEKIVLKEIVAEIERQGYCGLFTVCENQGGRKGFVNILGRGKCLRVE